MLVVTGVRHEADNAYSIRSTWLCYWLVRFRFLLIITTDFVALYLFTGYVVFIIISFLAGVESGDQCLHTLRFILFFWGHNEYKIVFSNFALTFLSEMKI